jgi:hypothetical protein
MKKLWLLVGIGVGFVLGSKAGRKPYERLEGKIREVSGRAEVKQAADDVSDMEGEVTDEAIDVATNKVADITDKVSSKVNHRTASDTDA